VLEELVSRLAAREHYGVVLQGDVVDEAASKALRERMRSQRKPG
jgi:hypothetical protein